MMGGGSFHIHIIIYIVYILYSHLTSHADTLL